MFNMDNSIKSTVNHSKNDASVLHVHHSMIGKPLIHLFGKINSAVTHLRRQLGVTSVKADEHHDLGETPSR